MRIGKKLYLIIVFFAILMGLSGFIGYMGINGVSKSAEEVSRRMALAESAEGLNVKFQEALMPPHDYIIHGNVTERDNFKEAWTALEEQFNEVYKTTNAIGCPRCKELIEEIQVNDLPKLKTKANEILNLDNPVGNHLSGNLMEEMDVVAAQMTDDVRELADKSKQVANVTLNDAKTVQQRSSMAIIFSGFWITFIGLAVGFFVSKKIVGNIDALEEGVQAVVAGDLTRRIRIKSRDELGKLANSFNQMSRRLEKSQRELELWGETLEDKIKERTKELVLANKQIRRRADELAVVFNVSKDISLTLDLKELLKRILKGTAPLVNAKFGAILLVDEEKLKRCWAYQEKLGKNHCSNCESCSAYTSDNLECWTINGTCC
ncbi:HAMP domain-containing protein [Candidatus Oleimmundimicrobium sp.]|uniref:HAMP domain-containing protein n=1 Tax=Candidatus Oleimmundimicrobium sp. TaxID=3060597 RepID=UPI002716E19D|nr:HAMP domain-containing protein [Candidatus Oleimmundimicrobium sp.]MDO8886600.1 HAMP domain-containing protein [Candidatus Oleimmundimicrobium sp.]